MTNSQQQVEFFYRLQDHFAKVEWFSLCPRLRSPNRSGMTAALTVCNNSPAVYETSANLKVALINPYKYSNSDSFSAAGLNGFNRYAFMPHALNLVFSRVMAEPVKAMIGKFLK